MKFRIVLTGAPCSGKTTTLNALKEKLKDDPTYRFIDEIATKYIQEKKQAGVDPFKDLLAFERTMMLQQIEEEDKITEDRTCTILDRSMIDDYAITDMLEVGKKENVDIASEMAAASRTRHYNLVFILDQLPFKNEGFRREHDDSEAIKQNTYIRKAYAQFSQELGFKIISVPVMPIEARADFIMREIYQFQIQALQTENVRISQMGLFAKSKMLGAQMLNVNVQSLTQQLKNNCSVV